MLFKKIVFLLVFLISLGSKVFSASFPILPEIQAYHNIGNRGSNYSTGGIGLSIHLYNEENGLGRYLHLLHLSIKKETFGWRTRVGDVFLKKDGYGYEIGVHDQWKKPFGKGASLTLRKINWPKVSKGGTIIGDGNSEILHLGWSWISGKPIFLVWLMGLDIASIYLPHHRIIEFQIGLGMRTSF